MSSLEAIHLRLYKEPTVSLVSHANAIGCEAMRRELSGHRRSEREIARVYNPADARIVQRRMARALKTGAFRGVLALAFHEGASYDGTARIAGCTWGVINDRVGKGVQLNGQKSGTGHSLRILQWDMTSQYMKDGFDGAMMSELLTYADDVETVTIDVPVENSFALERCQTAGFQEVGRSTDGSYFGRRARAAAILHLEAPAGQVAEAAAAWVPPDVSVQYEPGWHVSQHFLP